MKTIISGKQPIGGDGAEVVGSLALEGGNLIADARVTFPVAKLLSPVNDAIDKAAVAIEEKLPLGGGTKAVLDPIMAGLKAEILKLLSE